MPELAQPYFISPARGSVLRTPATLTGIRTLPLRRFASRVVLIPVVLRNGCRPAESKLSPDGNHSSGTYKVKNFLDGNIYHPYNRNAILSDKIYLKWGWMADDKMI
jgi:hypothetical protein